MRQLAVAFFAGVVFAVGLGVSGMTDPDRVLAFLDVAGPWDPSLAFVMAGAIVVHVGAARWATRAPRPLWAPRFAWPRRRDIDMPLVAGAALFGLGWGTAGYCPGPALVDLVAPSRGLIVFVLGMLGGSLVYRAQSGSSPLRTGRPSLNRGNALL